MGFLCAIALVLLDGQFLQLLGVEVQDEESGLFWATGVMNAPAWTLPQTVQTAVLTMLRGTC